MENDQNLLWIALSSRKYGQRPSQLLGIRAEAASLDLDLACSYRLVLWENEREIERLKVMKTLMRSAVFEAVTMWSSGKLPEGAEDEGDSPDGAEIPEDDIL